MGDSFLFQFRNSRVQKLSNRALLANAQGFVLRFGVGDLYAAFEHGQPKFAVIHPQNRVDGTNSVSPGQGRLGVPLHAGRVASISA